MKYILIVTGLLLTHLLSAQPTRTENYDQLARSEADTVKAQLELTSQQASQIEDATKKYLKNQSEIPVANVSLTDRKESHTRNRQEYDLKIKDILSQQQYKLYQEMLEARKKIMLAKLEEEWQKNKSRQ